jgi:hypothetical protein
VRVLVQDHHGAVLVVDDVKPAPARLQLIPQRVHENLLVLDLREAGGQVADEQGHRGAVRVLLLLQIEPDHAVIAQRLLAQLLDQLQRLVAGAQQPLVHALVEQHLDQRELVRLLADLELVERQRHRPQHGRLRADQNGLVAAGLLDHARVDSNVLAFVVLVAEQQPAEAARQLPCLERLDRTRLVHQRLLQLKVLRAAVAIGSGRGGSITRCQGGVMPLSN